MTIGRFTDFPIVRLRIVEDVDVLDRLLLNYTNDSCLRRILIGMREFLLDRTLAVIEDNAFTIKLLKRTRKMVYLEVKHCHSVSFAGCVMRSYAIYSRVTNTVEAHLLRLSGSYRERLFNISIIGPIRDRYSDGMRLQVSRRPQTWCVRPLPTPSILNTAAILAAFSRKEKKA